MAKHTQGQWRFYTEPQPNGCPIVGSGGLMICMLAHTVHQPEQREEALANARLIAAAPELLDSLQVLVERLKSGDDISVALEEAEQSLAVATEVPA